MKFFLKKGKLMVSGSAYAVSNYSTGVIAEVPSWQKIHSAIRQDCRKRRWTMASSCSKCDVVMSAWGLADSVSEKVLPTGKCPLWYRRFLTDRCYEAILRTNFFKQEKDPAMGYAIKLTLKKGIKL